MPGGGSNFGTPFLGTTMPWGQGWGGGVGGWLNGSQWPAMQMQAATSNPAPLQGGPVPQGGTSGPVPAAVGGAIVPAPLGGDSVKVPNITQPSALSSSIAAPVQGGQLSAVQYGPQGPVLPAPSAAPPVISNSQLGPVVAPQPVADPLAMSQMPLNYSPYFAGSY